MLKVWNVKLHGLNVESEFGNFTFNSLPINDRSLLINKHDSNLLGGLLNGFELYWANSSSGGDWLRHRPKGDRDFPLFPLPQNSHPVRRRCFSPIVLASIGALPYR